MYPSGVNGTKPNNSFSIVYLDLCPNLNSLNSLGLKAFAELKNLYIVKNSEFGRSLLDPNCYRCSARLMFDRGLMVI